MQNRLCTVVSVINIVAVVTAVGLSDRISGLSPL